MKKILLSIALVVLGTANTLGQTRINKIYDTKSTDELNLIFKYPELVQIRVWDGKEVKIEGMVNIQDGEFDDNFEIKSSTNGDRFTIESTIKNLENMEGDYSRQVYDDDSTSVTISDKGTRVNLGFRNKRTYKNGVYVSIELVVTVPQDMKVTLDARYGLVEVLESPEILEVDARYGGVDVVINESQLLEFDASTQWGQIFSNLEVPVETDGNDRMGKWMKASASLKKGEKRLSVESQYGNVYLRKN
ncbi:MAG: hypothetical protein Roseis2KO_20650 [Roseivirga sp.]